MVLCGQLHALRVRYLRKNLHGRHWTEGRVDRRGRPYIQEQSYLTKPELLGAHAVTQTLYPPSPPCSIISRSSMFYVKFCLLMLISIAGDRKFGRHDLCHHLMKRRPIGFSKLQFITNEFTMNDLGKPLKFIKTKTNYKIWILCLGNGKEDNRDKGKEWWMLPQNFSHGIWDINDKITFIEDFTDYPK